MKTTSTIILALGASKVSAGFFGTPAWGNINNGYENHDSLVSDGAASWNDFGKANNGYNGAWDGRNSAYKVGDSASQAGLSGHDQWANRASDFAKNAAVGHGESAGDSAARTAQDATGAKKYAYFTQGSGPNGFYSKGYYGSNGYEHEAAKAASNSNAQGVGFQKASAAGDVGSLHGGKYFDKGAAAKDGFGQGYDHAGYGGEGTAYGTGNFRNGFNKGYEGLKEAAGGHNAGYPLWG
uniref:Glycine-rich cell wall structural protein n=1 Tax=Strongyloides venezuelensis TaxID=75913 RepID=A0A0K0FY83_STRVS